MIRIIILIVWILSFLNAQENLGMEIKVLRYLKENCFYKELIDTNYWKGQIKEGEYSEYEYLQTLLASFPHSGIWRNQDSLFQDTLNNFKLFEKSGIITLELIQDSVVYLKIRSTPSKEIDYNKWRDFVQEKLKPYYHHSKWLVDLRDNRGGSAWTMLYPVAHLIPGGIWYHSDHSTFEIKNDDLLCLNSDSVVYQSKLLNRIYPSSYYNVFVLTGNNVSASELLMFALVQNPKTQLLGSLSGGLTTTTEVKEFENFTIYYAKDSFLNDNKIRSIHGRLVPDIIVPKNDALKEAIKRFSIY